MSLLVASSIAHPPWESSSTLSLSDCTTSTPSRTLNPSSSSTSLVVPSTGTSGASSTAISAQSATSFSLIYGYPLLSFVQFVGNIFEVLGANRFYNNEYLQAADSTTQAVVSPNQDTLYSAMVFDLSKESLNITIPEVPPYWFHLFAFYDPFGNNFANVGSNNEFNQPGSYLLRSSPNGASYGLKSDSSGTFAALLDSPTTYGSILVRWLIFNESSYGPVHAWQNSTTVTPIPLPSQEQTNGSLAEVLVADKSAPSPAVAVLAMLAKLAPYCPAFEPSDRVHVDAELKAAGIANGTYNMPNGVNITAANDTVQVAAEAQALKPGVILSESNDWAVFSPNVTGTYGTDYALRTLVAEEGYLELQSPNAYYPFFTNSSNNSSTTKSASLSTSFDLGAEMAYVYTFSGRPPLLETGFWSLTLYQDEYFVNNTLDRSALGDRSNLTFPDGNLVYDDGGLPYGSAPDGEFQILVQPADLSPPANWTSNWLPGPAGGGSGVSVLLRWYDAEQAVVNGSYVYPKVTQRTAVQE